jgi:hypothetical protein
MNTKSQTDNHLNNKNQFVMKSSSEDISNLPKEATQIIINNCNTKIHLKTKPSDKTDPFEYV